MIGEYPIFAIQALYGSEEILSFSAPSRPVISGASFPTCL